MQMNEDRHQLQRRAIGLDASPECTRWFTGDNRHCRNRMAGIAKRNCGPAMNIELCSFVEELALGRRCIGRRLIPFERRFERAHALNHGIDPFVFLFFIALQPGLRIRGNEFPAAGVWFRQNEIRETVKVERSERLRCRGTECVRVLARSDAFDKVLKDALHECRPQLDSTYCRR